ncbi:alginate O-acetyltransferase AlgX-related protein [Desulfonatronum parangueonense]
MKRNDVQLINDGHKIVEDEVTATSRNSDQQLRSTAVSSNWLCGFIIWVMLTVMPATQAAADELADSFFSEANRLAEEARERQTMTIQGKDGWLFFDQELAHIGAGPFWGEQAAQVSRATNPDFADPLPAILDFHSQLQAQGVDLLLIPVPPKAIIYPDMLSDAISFDSSPPRLDKVHQEFYALLRENNVQVLDLTETFLAERFQEQGPLYCRQDTHWSGLGCVKTAQKISNIVQGMPWFAELAQQSFEHQWQDVQISGDLWRALNEPGLERETLALRHVGHESASSLEPMEPDQASPIILLGDSHNLVFQAGGDMHARGAGLADQLALELGMPVDLIAVRGSGATPARINLFRRAQRDPDYWQGKKLVIWVFTAREFTHSDGWRMVPIQP